VSYTAHCVPRTAYFVAATAFLLYSHGSRAQTPSPANPPTGLAGCYVLTLSEWRRVGFPVPSRRAPSLITLDTLPVENAGWRLVPDVADSGSSGVPRSPRWRVTRDTVELLWSDGDGPIRVLLARAATSILSGYAIGDSVARWTDSKRLPTANAEGRRIACDTDLRPRHATEDTARLVDDRLVIEPVGVSLRLPPLWLGTPRPRTPPYRTCDDDPDGTLEERVHTDRRLLPVLTYARGEWKKEFSAVVDSVAPFDALVAQAGGGRWGLGGSCFAVVQMRVYVGDFSPESLVTRTATVGVRTARRFFKSAKQTVIDTAAWRGTRLSWDAWYYDYGGPAYVDFFARRVRGHTVALVFMYVGATEKQLAERALVLESFHVRP
jgi:hypothetical protein